MIIAPASPFDPDALALLTASHALMGSLFPAESNHGLDAAGLAAPGVLFFCAREDEDAPALGCGALALRDGPDGPYGEIKAMFTAPDARGLGLAAAILARLEAEARSRALPCLRLETGEALAAAIRLYARAGFRRRGPFGGYGPDPLSVFMEKPLSPA